MPHEPLVRSCRNTQHGGKLDKTEKTLKVNQTLYRAYKYQKRQIRRSSSYKHGWWSIHSHHILDPVFLKLLSTFLCKMSWKRTLFIRGLYTPKSNNPYNCLVWNFLKKTFTFSLENAIQFYLKVCQQFFKEFNVFVRWFRIKNKTLSIAVVEKKDFRSIK